MQTLSQCITGHNSRSPLASCSSKSVCSLGGALLLIFKADILCLQVTWDREGSKAAKERVIVDLQDNLDSQVCKEIFLSAWSLKCLQLLSVFVGLQLFQQPNHSVPTSSFFRSVSECTFNKNDPWLFVVMHFWLICGWTLLVCNFPGVLVATAPSLWTL